MTVTVTDYYQPGWRERVHPCPACDWQGDSRAMEMELHDAQTEYTCPRCELPLLIVTHPTLEQVRAAARSGNPEALQQLEIIEAYTQRS